MCERLFGQLELALVNGQPPSGTSFRDVAGGCDLNGSSGLPHTEQLTIDSGPAVLHPDFIWFCERLLADAVDSIACHSASFNLDLH